MEFNKEQLIAERKRIGKVLQKERKKQGYTQEALAEVLGVNTSTVVKIEGGAFSTGIDQINKFCSILKLQVAFKECY